VNMNIVSNLLSITVKQIFGIRIVLNYNKTKPKHPKRKEWCHCHLPFITTNDTL